VSSQTVGIANCSWLSEAVSTYFTIAVPLFPPSKPLIIIMGRRWNFDSIQETSEQWLIYKPNGCVFFWELVLCKYKYSQHYCDLRLWLTTGYQIPSVLIERRAGALEVMGCSPSSNKKDEGKLHCTSFTNLTYEIVWKQVYYLKNHRKIGAYMAIAALLILIIPGFKWEDSFRNILGYTGVRYVWEILETLIHRHEIN